MTEASNGAPTLRCPVCATEIGAGETRCRQCGAPLPSAPGTFFFDFGKVTTPGHSSGRKAVAADESFAAFNVAGPARSGASASSFAWQDDDFARISKSAGNHIGKEAQSGEADVTASVPPPPEETPARLDMVETFLAPQEETPSPAGLAPLRPERVRASSWIVWWQRRRKKRELAARSRQERRMARRLAREGASLRRREKRVAGRKQRSEAAERLYRQQQEGKERRRLEREAMLLRRRQARQAALLSRRERRAQAHERRRAAMAIMSATLSSAAAGLAHATASPPHSSAPPRRYLAALGISTALFVAGAVVVHGELGARPAAVGQKVTSEAIPASAPAALAVDIADVRASPAPVQQMTPSASSPAKTEAETRVASSVPIPLPRLKHRAHPHARSTRLARNEPGVSWVPRQIYERASLLPAAAQRNGEGRRIENRIAEVQTRLLRLGYPAGRASGVFDTDTQRAILLYQIDNDLPRTGEIDALLLHQLRVDGNGEWQTATDWSEPRR